MIPVLVHFFAMGGYGWYVWSAYSLVLVSLGWLLFPSLFRWQKYLREQKNSE